MKKYWPYLGDSTLFTFPFHDEKSLEKSYNDYKKSLEKMERQGVCRQIFVNNAYAFEFTKNRRAG